MGVAGEAQKELEEQGDFIEGAVGGGSALTETYWMFGTRSNITLSIM